jgi:hypothetical protein
MIALNPCRAAEQRFIESALGATGGIFRRSAAKLSPVTIPQAHAWG